ncbi:hypothetical protein Ddc_23548 [Ditylenchus destructor]|nr:hypothetical protein Ddc_23548 [Ditylenchus destructor]
MARNNLLFEKALDILMTDKWYLFINFQRFQRFTAQYFKFKVLSVGLPRNNLLRNSRGTLEMKIVALHPDLNGLRRDTVIIEQRPHTSVLDQQSTDPAQKMLLHVPNDSAQKKKITTIKINICYGTASFITSEGQKYADLPLSDYVPILREVKQTFTAVKLTLFSGFGAQLNCVFKVYSALKKSSKNSRKTSTPFRIFGRMVASLLSYYSIRMMRRHFFLSMMFARDYSVKSDRS